MSRVTLWVLAFAVAAPRLCAQDATKIAGLVNRIESRADHMLPDKDVPIARASLFRGELADARDALEALAALGEPAIPALSRLMGSGHGHLRANAAYAMGLVGGPKTVNPLLDAGKDSVPGVRYQVACALGNTGSAAALPMLNLLASDNEELIRSVSIQVSGYLRDVLNAETAETADQKIAGLVKLSYSTPACARLVAYGGAAVPPLIAALDDPDRGVVSGAAGALAKIGDARALDPLLAHFTTSVQAGKPEIKFAQAIAEFRGREVWPYLKKLLDNDQPPAQVYALDRIAATENPERLEVLRVFLQGQVEKGVHTQTQRASEVQVNAVAKVCEILARIGDKSFVEILTKIIAEAPKSADKSIVSPLAKKALDAVKNR